MSTPRSRVYRPWAILQKPHLRDWRTKCKDKAKWGLPCLKLCGGNQWMTQCHIFRMFSLSASSFLCGVGRLLVTSDVSVSTLWQVMDCQLPYPQHTLLRFTLHSHQQVMPPCDLPSVVLHVFWASDLCHAQKYMLSQYCSSTITIKEGVISNVSQMHEQRLRKDTWTEDTVWH